MIDVGAIARFHAAQARLLAATYDEAWKHGVASYEPDADPDEALPADDGHPAVVAAVGLGAVAAILARRGRKYRAPTQPDAEARARALTPAIRGLDRMAGELQTVLPTSVHLAAADALILAGTIQPEDRLSYASALAAQDWLDSNEWRLRAGESVAWAGEQQGYAEAADADGQLLEWLPEGDDRVCDDCEALGAMPPMPLGDWPTTPGSGDTICDVGCRCVLQVSDVQLAPGDELPGLSDEEEATISRIAEQRSEALEVAV